MKKKFGLLNFFVRITREFYIKKDYDVSRSLKSESDFEYVGLSRVGLSGVDGLSGIPLFNLGLLKTSLSLSSVYKNNVFSILGASKDQLKNQLNVHK